MSGKLSRSWQVLKSSARVLASEPDLLVLPVLALAGTILVSATIYFGIVEPLGLQNAFGDSSDTAAENETLKVEHLLVLFAFFFGNAFVVNFFNVALASAALSRFRGESGGFASGLACAGAKVGVILGYSAIVGGLRVIRKLLQDRGGAAGSMASGVMGIAVGIATFLVIPVIAAEKVNPISAIRRSASLLRETWGENIIGSAGIGLLFLLAMVLIAVVGFGAVVALVFIVGPQVLDGLNPMLVAILLLGGAAFFAMIVIWAALGCIYQAGVYAYAVDGSVPETFARQQIEGAFRKKGDPAAAMG